MLVENMEQLRSFVFRDFRDAGNPRVLTVFQIDEPDQTPTLWRRPAWDDVAVRAGARPAELIVEPVQHKVRHAMGELSGLEIGGRPVEAEHVGHPTLDDAMPAHDLRGRFGALLSQLDGPVVGDLDKPVPRE